MPIFAILRIVHFCTIKDLKTFARDIESINIIPHLNIDPVSKVYIYLIGGKMLIVRKYCQEISPTKEMFRAVNTYTVCDVHEYELLSIIPKNNP